MRCTFLLIVLARTTSTDYTATSFLFHTPEISIAPTTGNSQSIRSTQTIPNIMNKFGDEVVAEYLNDNPSIIDLLGFEEGKKNAILEFGSNSFKSNQISSLSGAVLGRMMLLDYQ
ncbi:hypothetical protein EAY09_22880, partial [Vibrio anguillarum]|nr:hypothetical protein [Vibrio anguillarum]